MRHSAEPLSFQIDQIHTFAGFKHALFAALEKRDVSKLKKCQVKQAGIDSHCEDPFARPVFSVNPQTAAQS